MLNNISYEKYNLVLVYQIKMSKTMNPLIKRDEIKQSFFRLFNLKIYYIREQKPVNFLNYKK